MEGPALDKDSLYTLPVTEDMKILQSIVNQMDSNYNGMQRVLKV